MICSEDALYEKMRWVTDQMKRAQGRRLVSPAGRSGLRDVQTHLYAAQSRDAFGHEISAGSPLRTLRREIYRSLIRAERALDGLAPARPFVEAGQSGRRIFLRSRFLTLTVDPEQGARLLEISDKVAERDLLDTRTRRLGAGGPASWLEHFFAPGTDVQAFAASRAADRFSGGPWKARLERSPQKVRAVFSCAGSVRLGRASSGVELVKSVTLSRAGRTLQFTHEIRNRSGRALEFLFGSEFNWNLKDAHVNRTGEAAGLRRFAVVDPAAGLQLSFRFGRPAALWHFPREAVLTDAGTGAQRVFEGIHLTPVWPVSLPARGTWSIRWQLTLGEPDGCR